MCPCTPIKLAGNVFLWLLLAVFIPHVSMEIEVQEGRPEDIMNLMCPKTFCYGNTVSLKCSLPRNKCTPPPILEIKSGAGGPPVFTRLCSVDSSVCGKQNPPEGTRPYCACVQNVSHFTVVYQVEPEMLFVKDEPQPDQITCYSDCAASPSLTYFRDEGCSDIVVQTEGSCESDELGKASKATHVKEVRSVHFMPGIILTIVNVILLH